MKKSSIPFEPTSPKATIIVNTDKADFYRNEILKGEFISEENDRSDNTTVFILKDIDLPAILYFSNRPDARVHYFELMRGNAIKICVRIHKNNFVDYVTIKQVYGVDKEGNQKWDGGITIYSRTDNGLELYPLGYEVSWPSIGAVSIDRAKMFALALETATILAEEFTEQYVKPVTAE